MFSRSSWIHSSKLFSGGRVEPVTGEIPNKRASALLHKIFGLMSRLKALSAACITYLLYAGLDINNDSEKT